MPQGVKLFHFLPFYAKISIMDIISLNDTSKLYLVGGVVRDELLGIKSLDVDIVYEGSVIEDIETLRQSQKDVLLNLFQKLYDINIQPEKNDIEVVRTNPDFGTVRVKLSGLEVDIASTRTERYDRKGHLPQVEKIGCSLQEDVMRRDFTVNSLYKSLSTGEIFDFTGGLEDLKNKKLRILHDKSFIDDPTRIIRALKFSHRFGFELDDKTLELRDEYLKNINYDMCYKRIKKELIETLGLNSDEVLKRFIKEKIYKLITENEVELPANSPEQLIKKYAPDSENIWLIYAGILRDLSRLELTRKEQKILDDFAELEAKNPQNDFEIYKAYENKEVESIILYAILKDEKPARHYLDNLKQIKVRITGKNLEMMGIDPSPKYKEIFDFVLKKKLETPQMTLADEICAVQNYITDERV